MQIKYILKWRSTGHHLPYQTADATIMLNNCRKPFGGKHQRTTPFHCGTAHPLHTYELNYTQSTIAQDGLQH